MILNRFTLQTGAILRHVDTEDALETNHVEIQTIPLELLRKVPAREDSCARTGTRGTLPEFFQTRVPGGVFEKAAKGRTKIGGVTRRIGDEVCAPIIEYAAVRVGEIVWNVTFEF